MTRRTRIAPPAIELTLLATLIMAFAAGCADSSSGGGKPNDDFEIRAMIAADRQQMQAMDERLRRMESQIQDLAHSPPSGGPEGNSAPATQQAPPSGAPAVQFAPSGTPPAPGAPMAPGGGEAVPPGAGAVPPGAPPGAAASPGTPLAGTSEGTTIASAPGPEAGGAPPPGEESPAQAGSAAGAAPGGSENDEGGSQEGATENGNPEAPAPPGASASASAPGAPAGEEGAPPRGEEVASAPPSTPENAPAAIPPARWPQDLAGEQASGNSKGGAGKLFRSGLEAMKSRDYSAAVERFGTLQKKYPHSDLTEPAAYFSASALNEMGKYDQAILQYNDLVMRYPSGKYASEALLREAQAFVQINDKVDARLTLQKLVNEHAGTPQAATAGAMMKTLESD
jgi:tol-pal system protein YbgF